jgi:hypothetical protein
MHEEIEFNDEEDGSVSIDFCAGQGKMLAISIEPNGKICWALHWDGHKEHGTHKAQQRTWVGLTDEEIRKAAGIDGGTDTWIFETAYAIEAKLKEKNT